MTLYNKPIEFKDLEYILNKQQYSNFWDHKLKKYKQMTNG